MTHSIVWARTYIHVQLYNTLFNRLSHHIWSILLVHYSNSIPRIRSQNHPTTVGGTLCIWYGWLVESISQPTRETLYKFWPLLWPRTVPFKSKTSNIENICFTDRDPKSPDILNLTSTSESGFGWSFGVETYAERYLESNRSKLRHMTVNSGSTWG